MHGARDRSWHPAALAACLLAVAAGCAADPPSPPPGEPPLGAHRPAIHGGAEVAAGEMEAVVAILVGGMELCAGTVVAPRVVLTAAHCLAGLAPGEQPEVHIGRQVVIGQTVAVAGHGTHPGFCASCNEDVNDFGYVLLADDFVVSGGFPAPVADQDTWDEVMVEGGPVTLVGYGASEDASAPFHGAGIKRAVETSITQLSDSGVEFLAGGDGKSTCSGDSGGPALVRAGGGHLIAGVLSRGECGRTSFYGAPYPALCWLRDATPADLVPEGCASCDCLDTSSGCGCSVPAAPAPPGAILALLSIAAAAMLRRARRRG